MRAARVGLDAVVLFLVIRTVGGAAAVGLVWVVLVLLDQAWLGYAP